MSKMLGGSQIFLFICTIIKLSRIWASSSEGNVSQKNS